LGTWEPAIVAKELDKIDIKVEDLLIEKMLTEVQTEKKI